MHDALPTLLAGGAGIWLIAKDWRDIFPRRRDTAAWRLGLHRPPLPLRHFSRAEPLPLVVALVAAAFGIINLLSALTPNIRWRGHLLLNVEPLEELHIFHALAIPASIALLVSAYYLYHRRLRALQLAVVLLFALGVFNLFKGLDFEEAIGDFAAAGILWAGRRAFYVRHQPITLQAGALRAPLVLAAGCVVSFALVVIAAPATASAATVVRETSDLLLWQSGPLTFHDEVGRLDLAVGLIGVVTLLMAAYLVFRPLAVPRDLPDTEVWSAAREIVRSHGSDTLAYFKLRRDKQYLFSRDRTAFLGYRVENRALIVSGDPVGPPAATAELLTDLAAFAEERNLTIAALGVSEPLRPSVRATRPPGALHGRRGDHRDRTVQPRRASDPQGASIGDAAPESLVHYRARRGGRAGPNHIRSARRCRRSVAGRAGGARLLDGARCDSPR